MSPNLAAGSKVFAFSQNAFVVVDIILPAMLCPAILISDYRFQKVQSPYWFWLGKRASKPERCTDFQYSISFCAVAYA